MKTNDFCCNENFFHFVSDQFYEPLSPVRSFGSKTLIEIRIGKTSKAYAVCEERLNVFHCVL